jgi:hypothetical protein
MSINDDYFDVNAALEGRPEQQQFNRIWQRFCDMERFEEAATECISAIQTGAHLQRQIESGEIWKRLYGVKK